MSCISQDPKCFKCNKPAEYDTPYIMCRFHWVEWALEDYDDLTAEEYEEEKLQLLRDIEQDYGPAPEYWHQKLIRELESVIR